MTRAPNAPYPVSAPYQGPEQIAAEAARLKRWTLALFAAAAALLVAMVALGVFWANLPSRTDPAPAAEQTGKEAPPPAPAVDTSAKARRQVDRLLDALGGLSGAHLYQSFLTIGTLADGVEAETYTPEQAEKMLAVSLGIMDQVDQYLKKLRASDLDPDDQQAVDRVRKLSAALQKEASALRVYWKSENEEDRDTFQEARDAAWAELREMLRGQGQLPEKQ
jgi:hypothetical protein